LFRYLQTTSNHCFQYQKQRKLEPLDGRGAVCVISGMHENQPEISRCPGFWKQLIPSLKWKQYATRGTHTKQ
jgi:hypothetical protein